MGGKEVLRIVLSASQDVSEALLSQQQGGRHLEVGLSDLVHQKYGGNFRIEIVRLPALRSDVLLQELNATRASGGRFALGLESPANPVDLSADIIVLSIQPDVTHDSIVVNRDGNLVDVSELQVSPWSQSQPVALSEWGEPIALDVQRSRDALGAIVSALKDRTNAYLIAFNGSTLDPVDFTYRYQEIGDTIPTRIRRLNLALLDLSVQEGLSILDVDRLVAELGGSENVEGPFDYSSAVNHVICKEFLRIIEDIGFFERRPLLLQLGRRRET